MDDDTKRKIIDRANIAARLFQWSDERHEGFREELARQSHQPDRRLLMPDPARFGLDEEFLASPGPERRMIPAERHAIGRQDAAEAFASWDLPAEPAPGPETLRNYARAFLDREDLDRSILDEIGYDPAFGSAELAGLFYGDPSDWLSDEHRFSILDGRSGHVDLVLQRIREPCVLMRGEDGRVDIADGWHRTAAAIVTGCGPVSAVIVPVLPAPRCEMDANGGPQF